MAPNGLTNSNGSIGEETPVKLKLGRLISIIAAIGAIVAATTVWWSSAEARLKECKDQLERHAEQIDKMRESQDRIEGRLEEILRRLEDMRNVRREPVRR